MMKRIALLSLSAALVTVALAQNDKKSVIVIVKATNSQYWQTVFDGARQAAKDMNVEVVPQGAAAESDIAGQIGLLENAVSRKPTAIVIAPTAAGPLGGPIDRAAKAGVPIVMIDSSANTNAYESFLTTDNEKAGALAADALVADIKAKTGKTSGKVAILTALPGVGSLTARDKGFKDRLAKAYPNFKVVANRYGNNDPAQALTNTLDILTANPDLVGIFADNNMMGSGAGRAIEERKLKDKVSVVAFDSDEQEIAYLKSGAIDALILQDPYAMGYGGVKAALAAAEGKKLPKNIDTGVFVATQKNFNSPEIQGLFEPSKRKIDAKKFNF